jgi:RAB protein geranylgeranyltransferase component A
MYMFYSTHMLQYFPMVQGFARLSAVYGGTYMLNKPECKVCFITFLVMAR